jgi:GT2 family glycosyltransferase
MDAMMPGMPKASLVIPSLNRGRLLLETVESVLAGTDVPAEIIVIDQSGTVNAGLAGLTSRRCNVRYIHSNAVGTSMARNTGVRLASHPLIGFIDDDVRVAPDWFAAIVRAAVDAGPRTVITGRVLPERPASSAGFVPSTITDETPREYVGRIGMDILYSNNMMLHRSAFEVVGLFDRRLGGGARFPTAEDNDLAFRLLEAGYRILYAPGAMVEHRAWRSGSDYLPLRWSYGRGQGAFYAKHFDLRDRYMLRRAGHDFAHNAGRMIRFLVLDPRRAAGQAVHLAGVATAILQWLITRPQEPAAR